jgi:Tol biopolymer transport system component
MNGIRLCIGTFFALSVTARAQNTDSTTAGFALVVAARQLGPVAYRDPIGVMSPNGQWLAYTSGGWLKVMRLPGGPVSALGPANARVLSVAWLADSRRVAAFEVDETGNGGWWQLDVPSGERRPLWTGVFRQGAASTDSAAVDPRSFHELSWSRDGARLAGITRTRTGFTLWSGNADGSNGRVQASDAPLSYPTWTPDGKTVACLITVQGSPRVSLPCGTVGGVDDAMPAYGPIAFSADGHKLYFASPNRRGTLDLWVRPMPHGTPVRLTNLARDSYAPSVAKDGQVLFGSQEYRTFIATVPSGGGTMRQVTTFQSETPSWSRDDRIIGLTYGSWRRIIDDMRYPDIAQDLGVVRSDPNTPATAPLTVIRASTSEDQGLDWSPNGRWIVLHSHADGHDDVWIQPADGSSAARPITSGGSETGWPRWSPDGDWIAYASQVPDGYRMRGALFTVGIDSARGAVTREARRVPVDGVVGDIEAVEWSATSDSLVFLAAEGLDRRAIYVVARAGGKARLVHRFTSEQWFSGIGVAPDFRWVAYIAPATDGRFQVFRVSISGGPPAQITFDPTDKAQPAVSRDGGSIAFTVFSYRMQFWTIHP